jgi:hypothetical protein
MADLGPWFPASFDSNCDDCDAEMLEGDQIRSDGVYGWLCGECGEDDD